MSTTIIATNVRLSFDKNLFDPDDKGKRSCNLIAQPDTKYFVLDGKTGAKTPIKGTEGLRQIVEKEVKAKFEGKLPPKWKDWAIRNNPDSVNNKTGERWSGYEDDNGIYFSPKRNSKDGYPAFVRPNGQPIDLTSANGHAEARAMFYGGCYVNAKFNIAGFHDTKEGSKGATTFIEGLQFARDGEAFGGGGPATAEGFDAVEQAEEEDTDL